MPCELQNLTLNEFYKIYKHRFKRIEFDNDLENRRTARICCIIANANRDKKKKAFRENDFMPKKEKSKKNKKMNVDQMANVLKILTIANHGVVK